jgi:outer membrane protein OmpA-like peptidoglycan-associated protein
VRRWLTLSVALGMLALTSPAASQTGTQGKVIGLKFSVLGLVFTTTGTAESVRESAANVTIQLAGDVLFDFNKADLTAQSQMILSDIAKDIDAKAKGPVTIDGYTDSVGDAAYNQTLSEQRAAAVQRALQALARRPGVTFQASGHGAAGPIAPNTNADGSDNPAGRAKNRRVTASFPK